MKYVRLGRVDFAEGSHPARGAWIEIFPPCCSYPADEVAPLAGAWIEIIPSRALISCSTVAPRMGCVD